MYHVGLLLLVSFRTAAEKAGFSVLRIISEPSAAVLAHNIGQENPSEHW